MWVFRLEEKIIIPQLKKPKKRWRLSTSCSTQHVAIYFSLVWLAHYITSLAQTVLYMYLFINDAEITQRSALLVAEGTFQIMTMNGLMHTEIQSTSIHQTLLCKDTKCPEPSGAVNKTMILFSSQSHSTLHEHTQTAIGKWLMGHSKKTVPRGISSGSWVWNKTTSVGLKELAGGVRPIKPTLTAAHWVFCPQQTGGIQVRPKPSRSPLSHDSAAEGHLFQTNQGFTARARKALVLWHFFFKCWFSSQIVICNRLAKISTF